MKNEASLPAVAILTALVLFPTMAAARPSQGLPPCLGPCYIGAADVTLCTGVLPNTVDIVVADGCGSLSYTKRNDQTSPASSACGTCVKPIATYAWGDVTSCTHLEEGGC